MTDTNRQRTESGSLSPTLGVKLSIGAYLVLSLAMLVYVVQRPDPVDLGNAEPAVADESAEPRLVSKISELDFGDVAIGDSDQKRFILFHDGASERPLTIFNAWIAETDSPDFTTDFSGPVELLPGDSLMLTVTFEPTREDAWVAPLYVSHDGGTGIEIFTMIGNGGTSGATTALRGRAISLGQQAKPNFGKSLLDGVGNIKPTSLQFGPDGKLYVADMLGVIKISSFGVQNWQYQATYSCSSCIVNASNCSA